MNPFIHADDGLIRVGGRSIVTFNQKHPIILPGKHTITTLILNYEHLKNMHGAIRFTLATIRTQFWPLRGISTIKRVLRNCVRCCRTQPKLMEHIMSNRPSSRVQALRPFKNRGVDYCGYATNADEMQLCTRVMLRCLCALRQRPQIWKSLRTSPRMHSLMFSRDSFQGEDILRICTPTTQPNL